MRRRSDGGHQRQRSRQGSSFSSDSLRDMAPTNQDTQNTRSTDSGNPSHTHLLHSTMCIMSSRDMTINAAIFLACRSNPLKHTSADLRLNTGEEDTPGVRVPSLAFLKQAGLPILKTCCYSTRPTSKSWRM